MHGVGAPRQPRGLRGEPRTTAIGGPRGPFVLGRGSVKETFEFTLGLLSRLTASPCEDLRGAPWLPHGRRTPPAPDPPLSTLQRLEERPLWARGTHAGSLRDKAACTCPARPGVFSGGAPSSPGAHLPVTRSGRGTGRPPAPEMHDGVQVRPRTKQVVVARPPHSLPPDSFPQSTVAVFTEKLPRWHR